MLKRIIFWLIVLVVLIISSTVGIPWALATPDEYSGQEVFNTTDEYKQFKKVIIDSGASWSSSGHKLETLASDPPIIVAFNVSVPQDSYFPYGKIEVQKWSWVILVVTLTALTLLVIYAILTLLGKEDKIPYWPLK